MTWFGVVADDMTGACDLADAVCEAGLSTVVLVGVPTGPPPSADCLVVALKTRSSPAGIAVAESVASARWLRAANCDTIYQKYCSTFDSTDSGNIGPVADALRSLVGAAVSVGTPATPRVARTVYQGHLFVGHQLLSESSMRDHPLTPMRDSNLIAMLARQTPSHVGHIPRGTIVKGPAAVAKSLKGAKGHVLLDAVDDGELDIAAVALRDMPRPMPLVGGAAGLAAAVARVRPGRGDAARVVPPMTDGRKLILSGSCSRRTREQVATFPGPRIELSPFELAADPDGTLEAVMSGIRGSAAGEAVLVSSSADPNCVAECEERLGPDLPSALVEAAMGEIANRAIESLGVRRILVAGGETSGAVVAALGLRALRVGPAAGPGLPWMLSSDGLALLLKSGNFGDTDLFTSAWEACA